MRLRSSASVVWPGGRLVLRAKTLSGIAPAGASKRLVLKIRRRVKWHRVDVMRRRGSGYVSSLRLENLGRKASSRRLGDARVPRSVRTLRLRVYVRGAGHSNIVHVRIRR